MTDTKRRPAAVVVGIFDEAPHGVVFIERAGHLRSHAGQLALPGGGSDVEDGGDLRVTAMREMHEEVGVHPDRVTIVGELPVIRARINDYAVTPFVAVVRSGELTIDATETAGVFTVPLETVLAELREGTVSVGNFEVRTPILDFGDRRIWGLTGFILRSFVAAWHDAQSGLRARAEALYSKR